MSKKRTITQSECRMEARDPGQIDSSETEAELGPFADNDLEQALRSALSRTLSPREKLIEASLGRKSVQVNDLLGLLSGRLLDSDEQASSLSKLASEFLQAMFSPDASRQTDPETALMIAERLTKLMGIHASEARRTSDLMARIMTPQRPAMNVLAVGSRTVEISQNRLDQSVKLGEGAL